MLNDLIKRAAKDDLTLAPFIGIGCPGVIRHDGSIERGGQNLPGNWEHKSFNLPHLLRERIPRIGDHETVVVMHNDAVVQGLSELPVMQDIMAMGRADDRHGPRQRAFHESRACAEQRHRQREGQEIEISARGTGRKRINFEFRPRASP